jgi:hypothetical protein
MRCGARINYEIVTYARLQLHSELSARGHHAQFRPLSRANGNGALSRAAVSVDLGRTLLTGFRSCHTVSIVQPAQLSSHLSVRCVGVGAGYYHVNDLTRLLLRVMAARDPQAARSP